MKQLRYYYDAILKFDGERYSVDYYCSESNTRVWAGRINCDSYINALNSVNRIVISLNKPKAFFGRHGKLMSWIRWKLRIRNLK